jgi:FtsZ-binding cell division protein ZapB
MQLLIAHFFVVTMTLQLVQLQFEQILEALQRDLQESQAERDLLRSERDEIRAERDQLQTRVRELEAQVSHLLTRVSERVIGLTSLSELDDDCTLKILTFLEAEDLNSYAICSRRCSQARSHRSLDQTRTGTIIGRRNSPILRIYDALEVGRWNNVLYSGNRTHLRVVGLDRLDVNSFSGMFSEQHRARVGNLQLTGVTTLDLSRNPHDGSPFVSDYCLVALADILPNLREIDLSYIDTGPKLMEGPEHVFICKCPNLTRITWNGSYRHIAIDGSDFDRAVNVTELYLNGAVFSIAAFEEQGEDDFVGEVPWYMLHYCKRLERLSIKDATRVGDDDNMHPLPQEMIIKFVRHSPTLQWLRSDLTAENVAMLQLELPDITFVTD